MARRKFGVKRDLPSFFLKIVVPTIVILGGATALYLHFRNVKEGVPVDYFEDTYPAQNHGCPVDGAPEQASK